MSKSRSKQTKLSLLVDELSFLPLVESPDLNAPWWSILRVRQMPVQRGNVLSISPPLTYGESRIWIPFLAVILLIWRKSFSSRVNTLLQKPMQPWKYGASLIMSLGLSKLARLTLLCWLKTMIWLGNPPRFSQSTRNRWLNFTSSASTQTDDGRSAWRSSTPY